MNNKSASILKTDSCKENMVRGVISQSGRHANWQVRQFAERSLVWLAAFLAFAIPLSTSITSVAAILVLVAWIAAGNYLVKLAEIIKNPVSLLLLLYLSLFIVGMLWTDDLAAGLGMINDQWKFLVLFAILCSVTGKMRQLVVYAFIAGVTVSMLLTYLAWFDIFQYGGSSPGRPARGGNVIYYNVLLAFAFYLVCNGLFKKKLKMVYKSAWISLTLLMAVNMFIVGGRAGQLVFFVLCGLLILQVFRKNILKAVLVILICLPLVFFGAYKLSPLFAERVNAVQSDIAQFHDNPNTSVGLRLIFWKNSWEMIKENPWLGVGTGDFNNEYEKINKIFSPAVPLTDNPHNQYVFALSKFGILGLLALLSLFGVQLYEAVRIKDEWQRVRLAFPVFFLTIMLTESYLFVYETGFLFALFSAVLFRRHIGDR